MQEALKIVKPRTVFVFGQNPDPLAMNSFLKRLLGLIVYTKNIKSGQAHLKELAGACGATKEAVRIGLRLLEAMGKIRFEEKDEYVIFSDMKATPRPEMIGMFRAELNKSLEECQAYRKYFRSGDLKNYLSLNITV